MEIVGFFAALIVFVIAIIGDGVTKHMKYNRWKNKQYDKWYELQKINQDRANKVDKLLNGRTATKHNLILEFDEALKNFDILFEEFQKNHQPGTVAVGYKPIANYHGSSRYHERFNMEFYVGNSYENSAFRAFCTATAHIDRDYEIKAYSASPEVFDRHSEAWLHSLALARYTVIQHGFLPSNVVSEFPKAYDPYAYSREADINDLYIGGWVYQATRTRSMQERTRLRAMVCEQQDRLNE